MVTILTIGSTDGLPLKITATEKNANVSLEIFQPIHCQLSGVYNSQLRQLLGLLGGHCHLFKIGTENSSTFKTVMNEKKKPHMFNVTGRFERISSSSTSFRESE
jgi:hypothetical protein